MFTYDHVIAGSKSDDHYKKNAPPCNSTEQVGVSDILLLLLLSTVGAEGLGPNTRNRILSCFLWRYFHAGTTMTTLHHGCVPACADARNIKYHHGVSGEYPPLFFFFFFIPSVILALLSRSLRVVAQIQGHIPYTLY